ncbi:IS66 family insertion sequence element accessory protein TnpA [Myroides odoratus]|uniref:IS66 family insertion sequence element accessory protein TnpA n=1 Tax=Myroides odoratus TaxID=256 RepID=UPI0039B01A83
MSKQDIMYSHVEDWKTSGLTQATYCEEQGLKLATFSYWIQKYYKQSDQDDTSSFIAISKEEPFTKKEYEIIYPNGVKLRVHTENLSELYSLLQLG